jgi:hypothetical protein
VTAALQVPAPSHVRVAVSTPAEHEAAAHMVPDGHSWHTPPAHLPSLPQVDAAFAAHRPRGSIVPSITVAQVPFAPPVSAPEQLWQAPPHAVLQQKPSTQKPLVHWSFAVQAEASGCSATQALPEQ